MTDPLLNSTDYAKFVAKDQDWFLGAAGETIRDYCGWHIAPVIAQTAVRVRVGAAGVIMLKSLMVRSVEGLYCGAELLDPDMYDVHENGWIDWLGWRSYGRGGRWFSRNLTVDFTHGYDTLPQAVAEVGFELTGRTVDRPTSNVTDITRGPTRIKFGELGAVLSLDQMNRLAPYRLAGGY